MPVIHNKTIEWDESIEKYEVVGHGQYEDSSVLAGQEGRWVLDWYDSLDEAKTQHPDAEVIDGRTSRPSIHIPESPPSWFDPMDAGEAWGEDEY